MINLVATRQTSGMPAELLRWYNDHVNLLMRFEGLMGATLYRCIQPAAPLDAPEYVCLYRFASQAAFAAFEASPAKELAREITASGWGQHGIEIVQRSQYPLGGKWTGQAGLQQAPSISHIQCLNLAGSQGDTRRWLADSLYLAANAQASLASVRHYQWHSSPLADNQQQVVVLASLSSPDTAWHTWWQAAGTQSHGQAWGDAPSAIEVVWQAGYKCLCEWQR